MKSDGKQLVAWAHAVVAAARLGGYSAADTLLRELSNEHGFDIIGMECAATLPGADTDAIVELVRAVRFNRYVAREFDDAVTAHSARMSQDLYRGKK